jgi:hypothetical protein
MKSMRISIEWDYMITVSLFPYISMEHKFKVYELARVARIYIVAILLQNFHFACLYGNQTMNYFNIILPDNFLQAYIGQRRIVEV